MRGSFEGLDNAPSTVIQPNGVGYDKKGFQTARYKRKESFKGFDISSKKFEGFKKYDKINRYGSSVAQNSSAYQLRSKMNIEKLFR